MFIVNKSLIPNFSHTMKIYLQKQKEVDQNNCEIESTLVKETTIFLKTDATLFNQLKNHRNLRC